MAKAGKGCVPPPACIAWTSGVTTCTLLTPPFVQSLAIGTAWVLKKITKNWLSSRRAARVLINSCLTCRIGAPRMLPEQSAMMQKRCPTALLPRKKATSGRISLFDLTRSLGGISGSAPFLADGSLIGGTKSLPGSVFGVGTGTIDDGSLPASVVGEVGGGMSLVGVDGGSLPGGGGVGGEV